MTYAIGQLVYGLDLQEPSPYSSSPMGDNFKDFRDEIEDLKEVEASAATGDKYQMLVNTNYSGNGDPPVYFGINLGEIDETETTLGSDLLEMLTITDEKKAKYAKLLEVLKQEATPALYEKIAGLEPYTFLTWGSS
jgi:hypothetical protein